MRSDLMKIKCEVCLTLRNIKPWSMLGATEWETQDMKTKLILSGKKHSFMRPTYLILRFSRDKSGRSMFLYASEVNRSQINMLRWNLNSVMYGKASPEFWDISLGRFLGYPECCIQQYARDSGTKSSAKRYFDQIKEMNIMDPFDIELLDSGVRIGALVSHIPCNPICKASQALKSKYVNSCPMNHGEICLLTNIF
jgi:hypothetical protein